MSATIVDIETFEVVVPLEKPLLLAIGPIVAREYAFVRITDSDGQQGTAYGLSRNAPIAATVDRLIKPHWIKTVLDDHQGTYDKTIASTAFLGTNGILFRALSVVDCAIYDLLAKRAAQPLYEFLGGERRPTPTTLAGCYPVTDETDASLAELMTAMLKYKPAGIKLTSSGDPVSDTARLKKCRLALGNDVPLINDLYCSVTDVPGLITEAQKWNDLGMLWLEDPFFFDDFESLAKLSGSLPYPVGVGDEQSGYRHFKHLMDLGGVSVLRLDATVCGGVREFIRIAGLAADRGVPVSCHLFPHLHAHLAAAIPGVQWIEQMLPESKADAIDRLGLDEPIFTNAGILPPETSGIGWNWDKEALHHFDTSS